jgi:hypothetical protein
MEEFLGQSSEIMRQPKMNEARTADSNNRMQLYSRSHLAVRLIVVINLVHLSLSFYQPYFRLTHRLLRGVEADWLMISSFLLPLFCAIESVWMRRADPSQGRSLAIDWLLVILWLIVWGVFLLHSLVSL